MLCKLTRMSVCTLQIRARSGPSGLRLLGFATLGWRPGSHGDARDLLDRDRQRSTGHPPPAQELVIGGVVDAQFQSGGALVQRGPLLPVAELM